MDFNDWYDYVVLDHPIAFMSLGWVLLSLGVIGIYERTINKMRRLIQEGKKMTGSIRAAMVREKLCDRISDTLDQMIENDEITVAERIYWAEKLAKTGLADLRHSPKPAQLKQQLLAKRIEEGKPTTLPASDKVVSMVEKMRAKLAS